MLADVVHELPVVQAPVLPQVVQEHVAEPLAAHVGAAHAQSKLAGLRHREGEAAACAGGLSASWPPQAGTPRWGGSLVPAGGQRGTHLDNLRLGVLEVQQQRYQPVQDLLEESLAVVFAELGQVAEEHDGRLAEAGLLLQAGDEQGSGNSIGV